MARSPVVAIPWRAPARNGAGPRRGRPSPRPALHVDPSLEDCSVIFAPELTQAAFRRFARGFGSVSAFQQAQLGALPSLQAKVSAVF